MIVLADTSVWIAHFRNASPKLAALLGEGLVLMHPCITGELACGNLKDRRAVISNLHSLPSVEAATDEEVLRFIEHRRLWGLGLGWVDAHLLASSLLSHCRLWTLDRSLAQAASELDLI